MNKKLESLAKRSKTASRKTALLSDELKKKALKEAAQALRDHEAEILSANGKDVSTAQKKKYPKALIDRLTVNPKRVSDMARALEEIAGQKDPVGEIVQEWTNKDGIRIKRIRAPLGVIGMIYESRPNVTVESASLCLKAGNSVILRGGSEAVNSNAALAQIFSKAIASQGDRKST